MVQFDKSCTLEFNVDHSHPREMKLFRRFSQIYFGHLAWLSTV